MAIFEFTPVDVILIRRGLGITEQEAIPDSVLSPYLRCLNRKHRMGDTGPLGASDIMNLLERLDLPLKGFSDRLDEKFDWRKAKVGMEVKIGTADGNIPGYFQAVLPDGKLAVRFKKKPEILEVPSISVMPIFTPELQGLDLDSIDQEDALVLPTPKTGAAKNADPNERTPPVELPGMETSQSATTSEPFDDFSEADSGSSWENVEEGAEVEVMVKGEVRKGTFVGVAKKKPDNVLVRINGVGTPRSIPQEDVDVLEPIGV